MSRIDVSAYTHATCLPDILVRMMMVVVVSQHNLAHFVLCPFSATLSRLRLQSYAPVMTNQNICIRIFCKMLTKTGIFVTVRL